MPDDGLHSSHRSRLREKFKKGGFDSLSFHEIVELLLFYPLPRVNTNETAHRLEDAFGDSISAIFEADDDKLRRIAGLSDSAVLFFRIMLDLIRRYNIEKTELPPGEIHTGDSHKEQLIAYFTGRRAECAIAVLFDSNMRKISLEPLGVGTQDSTLINVRQLVKTALDKNAAALLIAHNHVGTGINPSTSDIIVTRRVERTLSDIDIRFIGSYIICGNEIGLIMPVS
ncbi:UPF0758 protein [Clostridia bacterium]|nr:UPF0758 protein [Clostridia bacterium]